MLRISFFLVLLSIFSCECYWTSKCENRKCVKVRLLPEETPISHEVCELTCYEYSRIWPVPNGKFEIEREIVPIDLEDCYTCSGEDSDYLNKIYDRFLEITALFNDHKKNTRDLAKTHTHFIIDDVTNTKLELDADESYILEIYQDVHEDNSLKITITAKTLFGARNALETLSQIIVFDETEGYVVPKRLVVKDAPVYPVRGIMLDTGRNFLSVPTIKKVLEGMAMNKLNTMHWHIADTQSFPYESIYLPQLSALGAYSPKETYTRQDVKDIIEWARVRGIRIIPEFDGPAHVGEGWQDSDLLLCFKKQPWGTYCKEPPCGQFDPTKDQLYEMLRLLYRDMIEAFDPVMFHFGGDELKFDCWQGESCIVKWMEDHDMPITDDGFVQLWSYYNNRTHKVFMEERKYAIPGILWTSTMTDPEYLRMLPNDKYILHVWTDATDETIKNLLENDYRMIISNYDRLYLDCGFHSWVSTGNNWCSPYIGWKEMYENSPRKIVEDFGSATNKPHLIMGAVTALWTETVDDGSAENRIWPRASALAERVWAEPQTNWEDAEYRLNSHRERLIKLGINADTMVPQWCHLNQGNCR